MGIIEFDNVAFAYGNGKRVLDGISLNIEQSEFVVILGNNGSGKSTLARHMNALLVPDEGCVCVFGLDTRDARFTFDIRSRCAMVFQNPDDQIVASIVEDDVAFGPANLGVSADELRERVRRSLARVGLAGFERRETATLSGGQKQRLAIAGALAMEPDILVLDEPTSMLDPRGRHDVMRICRELNSSGMTVVLVTHSPDEAAGADRTIALGDDRAPGPPVLATRARNVAPSPREVLAFRDVWFRYDESAWVIEGMSLVVRAGEFLGIEGPTGAGKSTLVQLAAGLLEPTRGTISRTTGDIVGVAFQYPERQLFASTVYDDVAFGPRNLGLAEVDVESCVREALQSVLLDADELSSTSPFALSGGEQRRVALAGVLAMRPSVLLLDEPTASLDAPTRKAFIELIDSFRTRDDFACVIVSHDREVLELLCDRIMSMGVEGERRANAE